MTDATKITVWQDRASGLEARWIVSRDNDDHDTETITTHDDKNSAIQAAEQIAMANALPIVVLD